MRLCLSLRQRIVSRRLRLYRQQLRQLGGQDGQLLSEQSGLRHL